MFFFKLHKLSEGTIIVIVVTVLILLKITVVFYLNTFDFSSTDLTFSIQTAEFFNCSQS